MSLERCPCCWSRRFQQDQVIWDDLAADWRLSEAERAYIDRQQGLRCRRCGCNLRTMALGAAVCGGKVPLALWTATRPWLRVLEINTAGRLGRFLRPTRHTQTTFPDIDMMDLPYDDGSFDLVVHSDTLEHVPDPVKGLAECRRVLSRRGRLCYTVPIVVDRMTESRDGKPPSYHGAADRDYLVHREYGADAWRDVIEAGFSRCELSAVDFPAGIAITATG